MGVFNYWLVKTVQLYHLDSTLCGELVVNPFLLSLDFLGPYPIAYHLLARHSGRNVCSMSVCVCF